MIEFAKSMAGHDRNHIYLVTGKDERFVYLADGNVKLLAEPKKKNRKHIQIIHRLPDEVLGCLEQEITDLTVKRAIKAYVRFTAAMAGFSDKKSPSPSDMLHSAKGLLSVLCLVGIYIYQSFFALTSFARFCA